jgi:F0F1-type ATP synthase delta subunit
MTQTPALFDQITSKLRTTADVKQVLTCLETFVDTFFSAKKSADQKQIFQELPKAVADILIAAFASEPITPANQITIKRQIDELSDKLRACKSIQLTIAFQPTEETITFFSDWVKKNVSPDTLIDLQFDKSIFGGAQIIAGGVFKDYTVRKNLANRFRIQREDIMSLLD